MAETDNRKRLNVCNFFITKTKPGEKKDQRKVLSQHEIFKWNKSIFLACVYTKKNFLQKVSKAEKFVSFINKWFPRLLRKRPIIASFVPREIFDIFFLVWSLIDFCFGQHNKVKEKQKLISAIQFSIITIFKASRVPKLIHKSLDCRYHLNLS